MYIAKVGYYGGKGLPFFWTTLPGAVRTDDNKATHGSIAKNSFSIHKTLGTYGKYLIPIHIGGAMKHSVFGSGIWYRINPFNKPMH